MFERVGGPAAHDDSFEASALGEVLHEVPIEHIAEPLLRQIGISAAERAPTVYLARKANLGRIHTAMHKSGVGLDDGGSDGADDGSNADGLKKATDAVSGYVPTEVLPFYLGAVGVFTAPDSTTKLALFGGALILCLLLLWANSPRRVRPGEGRKVAALAAFAVIGLVALVLAMPDGPFTPWVSTQVGSVAVLFLSVAFYALNKRLRLKN